MGQALTRQPPQQMPLGFGASDRQLRDILLSLQTLHQTTADLKSLIHQRDRDLGMLADTVIDIRDRLPRREFSGKVKRLYREVSLLRFDGRCLICPEVRIVERDGRATDEAEYDHWFHHSEAGLDQGWVISREANRTLRHQRQHYRPEFEIFQRELRTYLKGSRVRRPVMGPAPGADRITQPGLFR